MSTFTLTRRTVRQIVAFQLFAAAILAALSLFAGYLMFVEGRKWAFGFNYQFYADFEENLPNWYAANVVLFNALLLAFIAWTRKSIARKEFLHWGGLFLVFVFLSLDEIASIHNKFDNAIKIFLDTRGVFYFAWVIPYGIFSVAMGVLYLNFLRNVPRRTAILMVVSGFLYVAAALGLEMVEGTLESSVGFENMTMAFLVTAEETLELIAMALFS